MKIKLEKAVEILENASAVIINDDVLIYPSVSVLTGDDENEFLFLSYEIASQEYYLKFTEGDNKEVEIINSSMFLLDSDADDKDDFTQITILVNFTYPQA